MPFEADGSYTDEYGNNSGAPAEVTTQEAPVAVADPGTDDSYGWLAALEAANAAAPQNGGSVAQQNAVVNNANEVLQSQPADAQNNPDYASNLDQAYFASAGASNPNATPDAGTGVPGVHAGNGPLPATPDQSVQTAVPAGPGAQGGTGVQGNYPQPTGVSPGPGWTWNTVTGQWNYSGPTAQSGIPTNAGQPATGTAAQILGVPSGTIATQAPTTGPGSINAVPGAVPPPAGATPPVPAAPLPANPVPGTGTTPVPGAGTATPPPPMPGGPGVGNQTGGTIQPTQQLLDDFLSSDPDLVLNLVQNRFRAQGASPVFLTWFNRNFQRYWGEYLGVIGQLAANGSIEGPMFIDWMLNQDNMHDFFTDTSGRIDTRFGLNRTADTGAQGVTV